MKPNDVLKMTASFVNCQKCTKIRNGSGKKVLTESWQPPRGWAGNFSEGDVLRPLMVVSLNPGHPFQEEKEMWSKNKIVIQKKKRPDGTEPFGIEHAKKILEFCTRSFLFKNEKDKSLASNLIFHKKASGYARSCLWLLGDPSWEINWLNACWFTDIIKCSTGKESGPYIPQEMFDNCSEHFIAEMKAFKPKAILALGKNTYNKTLKTVQKYNIQTPVVYFRHPSNGAPALDSTHLNKSFKDFVHQVEEHFPNVLRQFQPMEFRKIRQSIQSELFPRKSK